MAKKQRSGVFKKSELSSASDFDNKDFVPQEISPEYLEAVAARASSEKWISDHLRESETESSIRMVDEVELHDYSIIVYGKGGVRTLIPACRDTSEGGFIMIGPEVLKLFTSQGYIQAYAVWEALQHFGLMHHSIRDEVWVTGAAPVLQSDLIEHFFPTKSDDWIINRIKEVEKVTGMLKEQRRNALTREVEGFAYYPFLTYPPSKRVHYGVNKNNVDRFDEAGRFDGIAFNNAVGSQSTSPTSSVEPLRNKYEDPKFSDSVLYEKPSRSSSIAPVEPTDVVELFSKRYLNP